MATPSGSTDKQPTAPQGGTAMPRGETDWEAVEIAYCTTSESTRDIGQRYGISHTAVAKHAKNKGWKRPEKDRATGNPGIPPAAAPTPAPTASSTKALEPRQQRFVDEYLVDLNGTQAYMRAEPGTTEKSARTLASRMLAKVNVQAAIAQAQQMQQNRLQVDADRVVQEAWLIATADPRELVEVKTGCCRHCYGEGHKLQRTVGEMNAAREQWSVKQKPLEEFDEQGGIGFDPLLDPHPECPDCCGDGMARPVIKDTRYLSPQARALFAGAKMGKHGIEIQMHSKLDAIEKLAKHLGLYAKDNHQRSDPLALRELGDVERSVRMARLVNSSPETMAALMGLMAGKGAA